MKNEIRKLIHRIKWDLLFTLRYNVITVALIVTVLYTLVFKFIPGADIIEVVVSLIFSDPVMLGFMFIGAMVLFEKDANTLQALSVTPTKIWHYLWSKAIVLTLIALTCSIGMSIAVHGFNLNFVYLILGVSLTSLLFIFIGFIGVSKVKTFNQYIILIPLFLLPAIIPLVEFYRVFKSSLFFIIPTHGTLILLRSAFEGGDSAEIIYSIVILCFLVLISYKLAEKYFVRHVLNY